MEGWKSWRVGHGVSYTGFLSLCYFFPVASYLVTGCGLIQQMEPRVLACRPLPPPNDEWIDALRENKDADSVNHNSTAGQRGTVSPPDLAW